MKRKVACLLSFFVLLLPLAGCKFIGHPDYELSVTVEPGVTGTPVAGVYTHTELDEVKFTYTPVNSKHTVEVLIDGVQEAADSSLIIYKNTALVARLFDVRKTWKITYYVTDNTTALDFTITLTGSDILGGAFSDSRGHQGTWDASSGVLTFTFSDFESYKYTGVLLDMSGTWSNGTTTGTWAASLP
jgi:hypothetical protein